MRFMALIAALLLSLISFNGQAQQAKGYANAEAEIIKDGDTPLIEIRMYGIDTPEKKQLCRSNTGRCYKCGAAATKLLTRLLLDRTARYTFTGDVTYGRPVAIITIKRGNKIIDVNQTMIARGMAVAYSRYLKEPYKSRYLTAQQRAKADKLGIWAGEFVPPAKWRQGERLACEQ